MPNTTPIPIGAPDTLTTTAPERIWLQIDHHGDPNDRSAPFPDSDVTWCRDSVGGVEVEYVRADLASAAQPAAVAVPDGWKHDCAALLTNDVELWVDSCPHCGRPRAAAPRPPAVAPAPAAQGDALDAARYRYLTLEMGSYCITDADENSGGVFKAGAADAAIDAARAAKEGGADVPPRTHQA